MKEPTSILIIKLSAIGDVVHALPLLEVLRKNFPEARIDWLVEEEASEILRGHRALDRLIVSRRKSWQRRALRVRELPSLFREIAILLRELRSREYDIVIDLQGLLKSGVLLGLSRGKRKIGFSGGREGSHLFLTEPPCPVDYNEHALDRYLRTAGHLGCRMEDWSGGIPVDPADKLAVDLLLAQEEIGGRPLVAVNPVARWKTKLWDSEKFARLADRIQKELSCRIIFTGSPADRGVVDEITALMDERPVNLVGRTGLRELADLYSRCRLTVTTDTGPMHIAAAVGCPVVAIFGPTAPWRTGPYGNGHRVVREDLECSPCFKKRCELMTCMKNISVDRVFEAVRELIA